MNLPPSYSPGWEAPSRVQTPLTHSRHPSWNSHSPLELDPFTQDSLHADTSYPATNSFASSSDPHTSTPIYYNTFHGQYSNPHPFHGIPMHPNYFHPTAYMTPSPLPLHCARTPFWRAHTGAFHGPSCIWGPSYEMEGITDHNTGITTLHQHRNHKTRRIHWKSS